MDATLDSEDITLLNQLSDKQKDYALTLYTAREKKKSTAYILRKNKEILLECIKEAVQLYPAPPSPSAY